MNDAIAEIRPIEKKNKPKPQLIYKEISNETTTTKIRVTVPLISHEANIENLLWYKLFFFTRDIASFWGKIFNVINNCLL
jgi:hypothetical protein